MRSIALAMPLALLLDELPPPERAKQTLSGAHVPSSPEVPCSASHSHTPSRGRSLRMHHSFKGLPDTPSAEARTKP